VDLDERLDVLFLLELPQRLDEAVRHLFGHILQFLSHSATASQGTLLDRPRLRAYYSRGSCPQFISE
jgi:hypothetical protein